MNRDELFLELKNEVEDYRHSYPEPHELSPRLELAVNLAEELKETARRLDAAVELMRTFPILSAESSEEPEARIATINFMKLLEVAEGLTHPDEWVSIPCGRRMGKSGPRFAHGPHWWSEYEAGRVPLRVVNYCDGEI